MLARTHRPLYRVLLVDVADEILLEPITGRRTDPATGHIYHLTFDPPPAAIASRLIQRPDDTAAVLVKRLNEYRSKTAPLVPYFRARGVLAQVDGMGTVEQVQQRILRALGVD